MPVIPGVSSFGEALLVGLLALLAGIIGFLPALLAAILILVAGWLVSGFVARLLETLLNRVGFEQAATRAGISGFIGRAGQGNLNASHALSELVKWFIRLVAIDLAANAVGLIQLVTLINRVILWLPNLFIALVVLLVAAILARLLSGMVRGAAAEARLGSPDLLAGLTRYAVIGFAVLVALTQLGIASDLIVIAVGGLVGGLALGVAIAFGLGGRGVTEELWREWGRGAERLGSVVADRSHPGSEMAGMPDPEHPRTEGTGPQGAPPVGLEPSDREI